MYLIQENNIFLSCWVLVKCDLWLKIGSLRKVLLFPHGFRSILHRYHHFFTTNTTTGNVVVCDHFFCFMISVISTYTSISFKKAKSNDFTVSNILLSSSFILEKIEMRFLVAASVFIKDVALLRFNTAPLGAVHSGGAGDLFPRDCTALKVKSSIPQSSALRIFIFFAFNCFDFFQASRSLA